MNRRYVDELGVRGIFQEIVFGSSAIPQSGRNRGASGIVFDRSAAGRHGRIGSDAGDVMGS
jgi:hypothetical protein